MHDYTHLVNHISRLEGQLASIKKDLLKRPVDCTKAATTLRAASRSFSSLRQAFITCFLSRELTRAKSSELDTLLSLINS
jgi:DNA-binding FrmR family transcriptional regulator